MNADPKSAYKYSQAVSLFLLLGCSLVKGACKTLTKLTPGLTPKAKDRRAGQILCGAARHQLQVQEHGAMFQGPNDLPQTQQITFYATGSNESIQLVN